jgi:hydrogenase maturation protein HypF
VTTASFEGQAPMHLEAVAGNDPTGDGATEDDPTEDDAPGDDTTMSLPLARDSTGVWRTDWAPLLPALCDARRTIASRAALFHASLAAALLAQATVLRAETGISRLGLTGGVFQNRRLTETVQRLAEAAGFSIVLPECLPCNDAGLSFGQLVEADACP